MIDIVFLGFAIGALALFRFWPPAVAVLATFLGGWILLPVGHYPAGTADAAFPYWITGLALPSDMLLTKAWVAPAAAALGAAIFDRPTLAALRPRWRDAPMALWCLWPLPQAFLADGPRPHPLLASLYLFGSWGLPWLLGRAYFASREAQGLLLRGLVVSALACLPFSLIEAVLGPVAYGAAYEPHPFRGDGAVRYFGFRPIGFFEHGNQFGLWLSLSALAAVWLAVVTPQRQRLRARALAGVVVAMAMLAQSVGALLLLVLGAGFLTLCRWLSPRRMAAAALLLFVVLGAVYASGVLPLKKIGLETSAGRAVYEGLRAVGRGSFTWRLAQDQKLLPAATAQPLLGQARWDWWAAEKMRPWGLPLLTLGQFGLVGLAAMLTSLLWPALRVAWRSPKGSAWRADAQPLLLATLVVLAVLDALLNSFIFFPAVLLAGALAVRTRPRRGHAGDAQRPAHD